MLSKITEDFRNQFDTTDNYRRIVRIQAFILVFAKVLCVYSVVVLEFVVCCFSLETKVVGSIL